MIRGINGATYIDLESHVDMEAFEKLQPEIFRGFALGREFAKEGTWMKPYQDFSEMSYVINWKPIYKAIEEFLALPDDDPIKMNGIDLYKDFKNYQSRNKFTRYLKMAMGAYDPYTYYFLWEEGEWDDRSAPRRTTGEADFFPGVVKWVEKLVEDKVFKHVGRVIFFHCDADGIPFEHRDLDSSTVDGVQQQTDGYTDHRHEFIHIRPDLARPFYIWDPEKKNKIYINSRVAWWNDQDWHGGDRTMRPSYGLRIDGEFTQEFRDKINVGHLTHY